MLAVFATGGGGAGESTSIEESQTATWNKFLFTILFLGFLLQVPLLQDLSSFKKNALLHVMEGESLWKAVYLLFHLVKVGELTST